MRLKTALICGLLSCAWVLLRPAFAADQQNLIYDDHWLNQRYDWVLYVEPKTDPNFLKYPTSGLNPLAAVKVDYRLTPRMTTGDSVKHIHYEDLWYHDARAIGCRKFCKLPFKEGWQGAICVPASGNAATNPGAIAGTIVRLLLDVSLLHNTLVVVLAPREQGSVISDQLGQFKFFRTDDNEVDNTATVIHLFVSSGDINDRTFLKYEPRR